MKKGFTLAELLIALVILGVIAAFTIPKVLYVQQEAQKRAILKETIAAIAEIQHSGVVTRDLTKDIAPYTYFSSRLNYLKKCVGCVNWPTNQSNGEEIYGAFFMPNGAVVIGVSHIPQASGFDGLIIDWNGSAEPNTMGVDGDQLYFVSCYDRTGSSFNTWGCSRQDTVGPLAGVYTVQSTALWYWVFN